METIIIQDTSEDVLDVMSLSLELKGYNVHVTKVLDEHFLDLIASVKPHVVLVDYRLHGEDAIHICHLVRAFYPNLPVIAMSCNTNINNEFEAGGFDWYLDKPFDIDVMYAMIRRFIPKVRATRTFAKLMMSNYFPYKFSHPPFKLIV